MTGWMASHEQSKQVHRASSAAVSLRATHTGPPHCGQCQLIAGVTGASGSGSSARAGMRRAKLEGRHIGRRPLDLDRAAIVHDRERGKSLGQIAKTFNISRTTVSRVLHAQPEAEAPYV